MLTVIFVWKSSFLLSDFLLIPSFKKSCYKDSLHNYCNWKLCNKKGLVSVSGECDNIGNLIQFPLNWRVIFFLCLGSRTLTESLFSHFFFILPVIWRAGFTTTSRNCSRKALSGGRVYYLSLLATRMGY